MPSGLCAILIKAFCFLPQNNSTNIKWQGDEQEKEQRILQVITYDYRQATPQKHDN